ncbi:BC1872 family protein [Paenibacillus sp. UASWS1643]|uniref:BC1872 family protein n=1 Tax=Paenibacillus sp. UASWS1643 TaxID=2580422 RepID=UPI001239D792|nr:hypothetical protein [Paenibacillus sp. UASWS1643]KAA8750197.1 hypothetical protein FE296_16530 [Paenibacillus sp. UASWS1643]
MKREEIIAKWGVMSARERDAWIAELFFGWNLIAIERANDAYEYGVTGVRQYSAYTSDMNAAWKVIGLFPSSRIDRFNNDYGHECSLFDQYGTYIVTVAGEYSAPEAIGLAAIIAKLSTED